eukprot:COSAG02_NODE_1829_length_10738_cov_4.595827_5_plen_256_part_00
MTQPTTQPPNGRSDGGRARDKRDGPSRLRDCVTDARPVGSQRSCERDGVDCCLGGGTERRMACCRGIGAPLLLTERAAPRLSSPLRVDCGRRQTRAWPRLPRSSWRHSMSFRSCLSVVIRMRPLSSCARCRACSSNPAPTRYRAPRGQLPPDAVCSANGCGLRWRTIFLSNCSRRWHDSYLSWEQDRRAQDLRHRCASRLVTNGRVRCCCELALTVSDLTGPARSAWRKWLGYAQRARSHSSQWRCLSEQQRLAI